MLVEVNVIAKFAVRQTGDDVRKGQQALPVGGYDYFPVLDGNAYLEPFFPSDVHKHCPISSAGNPPRPPALFVLAIISHFHGRVLHI